MNNPFLDKIDFLHKCKIEIDDSDLISELLVCLNKLDKAISPTFKNIIDNYPDICYNYSIKNKEYYRDIILNKKYDNDDIYYEDDDYIILVFDYEEYVVAYTFSKNIGLINVDKYVFINIMCDLIEECIDELTL